MATKREPPLLVICGPTASGKSGLAMKIALEFGGEIICADSRTVYTGMDIGTAKPTKQDQHDIRHHLLNVVEPGQPYSAYTFQQQARKAIKGIRLRQKLPIMVGGTGLYIDSVLFDYTFPRVLPLEGNTARLSVEELRAFCKKNGVTLPTNSYNRRHLVTAITHKDVRSKKRKEPLENSIIVGITTEKKELEQKIAKRAEYIFSHGVVEEAIKLGEMYGWDNESFTANIYPIIRHVLNNELTIEDAKAYCIVLDRKLAKRQLTWLKRNPFIVWHTLSDAETFLFNMLAKSDQK
jgi:tRNA dimethylallyltransferase